MAPPSPEMAELVTPDHLTKHRCRAAHRRTTSSSIDSSPLLQDVTLAFLDQSDVVFAVLTLEITNIKNMRQFLALTDQLGYPEDKVQLLLNRADSGYGIRQQDVESSIGRKISHSVVSDGRTVVYALNRGVPVRRRRASDARQRGHRPRRQGRAREETPRSHPEIALSAASEEGAVSVARPLI